MEFLEHIVKDNAEIKLDFLKEAKLLLASDCTKEMQRLFVEELTKMVKDENLDVKEQTGDVLGEFASSLPEEIRTSILLK